MSGWGLQEIPNGQLMAKLEVVGCHNSVTRALVKKGSFKMKGWNVTIMVAVEYQLHCISCHIHTHTHTHVDTRTRVSTFNKLVRPRPHLCNLKKNACNH